MTISDLHAPAERAAFAEAMAAATGAAANGTGRGERVASVI